MPSKQNIKHLLELSVEQQQEFLESFDIVFSDCDGVVWLIVGPIPRAGEGVRALQRTGKRCVFVSNYSLRSDEEYQTKLQGIGSDPVDKNNLTHPAKAILSYLKEHKANERIFSIASGPVNEYLSKNGVDLETMTPRRDVVPTEVPSLLNLSPNVGAVVLDININLTYMEIAKACEYLKQDNCVFIVGGLDTHMPISKDIIIPGFENTIRQISNFTKKEPIVLGKPSMDLVAYIKKFYKITEPQRCLFIGDSLVQDIGFGKKSGFQTVFCASTGAYTKKDMYAAPEEHQPDYYVDGIADFAQLIENVKRRN